MRQLLPLLAHGEGREVVTSFLLGWATHCPAKARGVTLILGYRGTPVLLTSEKGGSGFLLAPSSLSLLMLGHTF